MRVWHEQLLRFGRIGVQLVRFGFLLELDGVQRLQRWYGVEQWLVQHVLVHGQQLVLGLRGFLRRHLRQRILLGQELPTNDLLGQRWPKPNRQTKSKKT